MVATGVLLGNKVTESNTQTLTHTLWSLLNLLPSGENQRPHRHNSVALDLCVAGPTRGAYTLMGPELGKEVMMTGFSCALLDWVGFLCAYHCGSYSRVVSLALPAGPDGWVKDPIRVDWGAGGCFVTPPGWWHSHHNDSPEDAWVLPLQVRAAAKKEL